MNKMITIILLYRMGHKKQVGCTSAIFAFRRCAQYFIERGSTVFMAALDAKKSFCLSVSVYSSVSVVMYFLFCSLLLFVLLGYQLR